MPKDSTKVKALYDAASKEYNLGTLDEFSQKLDDPAKRQALYGTIGKEYNLGDYDSFNKKLGYDSEEVKKKTIPPLQMVRNRLQNLRQMVLRSLQKIWTFNQH